ncbi:MAG: hypothetical protein U0936_18945 [Planctomycetaceae bacterium]
MKTEEDILESREGILPTFTLSQFFRKYLSESGNASMDRTAETSSSASSKAP